MNKLKDELKENTQRAVVNTLYTELITSKSKLKDILLFNEGKTDKIYYYPLYNHYLGDDWAQYAVGSKKNVLELCEKIKRDKNFGKEVRFFVDKDFDSKIEDNLVYTTPCYSIENFYIGENIIRAILKTEFNFVESNSEDRKEIEKVVSYYKKREKEFIKCIKPLVYWYYYQKSNDAVNLSNLKEISSGKNPLIKFEEGIKRNYNLSRLQELTQNFVFINKVEYKKVKTHFLKKDPVETFRGKYLFEFLKEFMNEIIRDGNQKKGHKIFLKQRKTKLMSNSDLLSTLCQYSKKPDCLKKFLEKIKID